VSVAGETACIFAFGEGSASLNQLPFVETLGTAAVGGEALALAGAAWMWRFNRDTR